MTYEKSNAVNIGNKVIAGWRFVSMHAANCQTILWNILTKYSISVRFMGIYKVNKRTAFSANFSLHRNYIFFVLFGISLILFWSFCLFISTKNKKYICAWSCKNVQFNFQLIQDNRPSAYQLQTRSAAKVKKSIFITFSVYSEKCMRDTHNTGCINSGANNF